MKVGTFDRDHCPPFETTLALIDAGVVDRLAFGARRTSSTARVHVMRYWPEDTVPAGAPLADLGPAQVRAVGLYIPIGCVGWTLCGLRVEADLGAEPGRRQRTDRPWVYQLAGGPVSSSAVPDDRQ